MHAHPQWLDRALVDLLRHGEPGRPRVDRGRAMAALRRCGLAEAGDQPFGTLSGGRRARFLVFGADGRVYGSAEPVFDETCVQRPRWRVRSP